MTEGECFICGNNTYILTSDVGKSQDEIDGRNPDEGIKQTNDITAVICSNCGTFNNKCAQVFIKNHMIVPPTPADIYWKMCHNRDGHRGMFTARGINTPCSFCGIPHHYGLHACNNPDAGHFDRYVSSSICIDCMRKSLSPGDNLRVMSKGCHYCGSCSSEHGILVGDGDFAFAVCKKCLQHIVKAVDFYILHKDEIAEELARRKGAHR